MVMEGNHIYAIDDSELNDTCEDCGELLDHNGECNDCQENFNEIYDER
jgi:hypothetical protein